MSPGGLSGHFIAGGRGALFVLLREPDVATQACVIVVPAFAEEMNKCRRLVALVARELTRNGIAVLVPDLYGTGDSNGSFSEADWDTWQQDMGACVGWARQRGLEPAGLLGIRLGAALAIAAVESGTLPAVKRSVLLQPVFDGERFLSQFLRLRVAAMLMSQDRKETLAELRGQLKSRATIEVAGYPLTGKLTAGIDSAKPPDSLPAQLGEILWLEVVRELDVELPGPSQGLIDRSRAVGRTVKSTRCVGEPFWSSTEIVIVPEVIKSTVAAFTSIALSGPVPLAVTDVGWSNVP